MKDLKTAKHDLKRDLHNILSLLKFIKQVDEVKDPEIKLMLDMALKQESSIHESLETLNSSTKDLK